MRSTLILAGCAALAASAVAASPRYDDGEAALSARLGGRVAGQPVSCVSARQLQQSTVIDGTAIVYKTTGSRVYVNRPRGDLRQLRDDNILITRVPGTQLCDADIVDLASRNDGFSHASVTLGEFVPYDRPRR